MMEKCGNRAIREFTLVAHKQFGMQVIVLAGFMKEGNPLVSLWVV